MMIPADNRPWPLSLDNISARESRVAGFLPGIFLTVLPRLAGIAHGGSLILSASILALIEYEEAVRTGSLLDPSKPKRRVLGVDIDIRAHNRTPTTRHSPRT